MPTVLYVLDMLESSRLQNAIIFLTRQGRKKEEIEKREKKTE